MKTNTLVGIVSFIIVVVVIIFAFMRNYSNINLATNQPINNVLYSCNSDKTITVKYYNGQSKPPKSPNQPPVPGGSVNITLSDSRVMTLPQTISADGGRYANTDESIVFWDKGNGAIFTESGQQTYIGCIKVAKDLGGLIKVYANDKKGFSLRYPSSYVVNDTYKYQELGPSKDIAGVKFTIPTSISNGTNLSSDSYISIEKIPQVQSCNATLFLGAGVKAAAMTDNNTTYSVASSTGAAAGNRYEETVYAIPGTNPCMAVRYFVHYGSIGNYPTGSVKEFNKQSLLNQFDLIRHTLTIAQ